VEVVVGRKDAVLYLMAAGFLLGAARDLIVSYGGA
jgi:hypothetical protein